MEKKKKKNFHDVIIQCGMTTSGPGSDSHCLLTKPKVPLVLLLPNKQTWQNKSWNESRMKLTVAIFDEWVFFCQLCWHLGASFSLGAGGVGVPLVDHLSRSECLPARRRRRRPHLTAAAAAAGGRPTHSSSHAVFMSCGKIQTPAIKQAKEPIVWFKKNKTKTIWQTVEEK